MSGGETHRYTVVVSFTLINTSGLYDTVVANPVLRTTWSAGQETI